MEALNQALRLSRQQLSALEARDDEAFLAGMDNYEAACLQCVESLGTAEPGQFAELVELNERIASELERRREETAARLAALRQAHVTAGTYLSTPAPTSLAPREA